MSKYTAKAFAAGSTLLFLITTTSAFAQGMTEVSGKYTNEAGVEITFPDGWSGMATEFSGGVIVLTAPGGISESEVTKSITLVISDKSVPKDPNDPSSFSNDIGDCNTPAIKSRTVAGVQGTEVQVDCPSTSSMWKMVAVETGGNWIAVMYMAPSSEFDADVAKFDAAVDSLKVQGAINSGGVPSTPTEEEQSSMMSVIVGGESIQVSIESSSTISEFALNEASKMISFKTDGTGTETTVAVGKVLDGPYTVMVDGEATTDYEESTDSEGAKTITTSHGSGAHDVSITGTQVVPEFPVAMIGIIAAIIGIASVIGRTNLMKGRL